MINPLASILVLLSGLYLIGRAVVLLVSPAQATRFLGGFASSASTHHLELVLRLTAGVAIVLYAPHMLFSGFFVIFGWVLVVTTGGLFAVPWQWHQRFARRAVPYATRNLRLVSVASFAFGVFVLASVGLGGVSPALNFFVLGNDRESMAEGNWLRLPVVSERSEYLVMGYLKEMVDQTLSNRAKTAIVLGILVSLGFLMAALVIFIREGDWPAKLISAGVTILAVMFIAIRRRALRRL